MKAVTLMQFLVCMLAMPIAAAAEDADKNEELREEMEKARMELAQAASRVAELGREIGVEAAENVAFRLFAPGGPPRAMLGIAIDNENHKENHNKNRDKNGETLNGVEVLSVTPGGPADKAGIQAGDVLTAIGETRLADAESPSRALMGAMHELEPGAEIDVRYRRGDDDRSAQVTVDAFGRRLAFFEGPDGDGFLSHRLPRAPFAFLDLMQGWGAIELAPISPGLGEYFGTDEGLLVVRAPRDDEFKLQDGDVILAIGGRIPEDPAHAMRILRSYRGGEELVIDILRKREKMTLEIVVPERRASMIPRIERKVAVESASPK